ncbi:MAG: hypothetical protein DYH13_04240 [Alphaproteobacteria bacterium PRO2]|nr:hypothetical protein [Alphaproteobacteria bacterium PRO2]
MISSPLVRCTITAFHFLGMSACKLSGGRILLFEKKWKAFLQNQDFAHEINNGTILYWFHGF